MVSTNFGIAARLACKFYNRAECLSALRGDLTLPGYLGNDVVRACLIAGLRKHPALARLPEVGTLCAYNGASQAVFARARNAGLIMGNQLPDEAMMGFSKAIHPFHPYCIWYPHVAKEETYRELARRFPAMKYQVGRACAVGGYAELFHELDILPDVSIAEEARERDWKRWPGSKAIFKSIMSAPARFRVMNDYDRTIDPHAAPGAQLNADTAVFDTLRNERKYDEKFDFKWRWEWRPFNITEDFGIAEHDTPVGTPPVLSNEETQMIDGPLPFDLPTMNKHLLLLMAAYTGNVDRYARLRRPLGVQREFECLLRGIYHSPFMATWLARNHDIIIAVGEDKWHIQMLWRAIHARRVMNNSIEQLLERQSEEQAAQGEAWVVPDDELPYFIWYPTVPKPATLWRLASNRPAMAGACARACIAANYREVFTDIMNMDSDKAPPPNYFMLKEAKAWGSDRGGGQSFYEEFLERRIQELQASASVKLPESAGVVPFIDGDPSSDELFGELRDCAELLHLGHFPDVLGELESNMYEGRGLETGKIELWVSVPEWMKQGVKDSEFDMGLIAHEGKDIVHEESDPKRMGYLPGLT